MVAATNTQGARVRTPLTAMSTCRSAKAAIGDVRGGAAAGDQAFGTGRQPAGHGHLPISTGLEHTRVPGAGGQ